MPERDPEPPDERPRRTGGRAADRLREFVKERFGGEPPPGEPTPPERDDVPAPGEEDDRPDRKEH